MRRSKTPKNPEGNHTWTLSRTPQNGAYRARFGVRIVRHAWGPRFYLAGVRIHHGSAGAGAIALGLAVARRNRLAGIGLAVLGGYALWDDRADFPFRDCDNHAPEE